MMRIVMVVGWGLLTVLAASAVSPRSGAVGVVYADSDSGDDCAELAQLIAGLDAEIAALELAASDLYEESADIREAWSDAQQALDSAMEWQGTDIDLTEDEWAELMAEFNAAMAAYNAYYEAYHSILNEAEELTYLRDYWVEIYAQNCL